VAGQNPWEQIRDWEYCYCRRCRRLREAADLRVTEKGIQCSRCGGFELEAPGWVICPHQKLSAVKCARAGRGITWSEVGYTCNDRCYFRNKG
jgi:hypothetical protein